ncbi:RNA polymerase sigma-70 factor [Echinicola salinicaeni]|uniref:RNA polymerase sigma-70 factor n=1 Tax=Echinicola salinicaeni TaxID=2762757 RepID=UPI00164772B0|nr:RNA polymerase sigma-70 factor [Echinicola salinicaeni]
MREVELLFRKYYPRLCAYAMNFLEDEGDAEDIVQDVFHVYMEKKSSISNQSHAIKSFLYTSVKNACLNNFRHQKVKDKHRHHYLMSHDGFTDSMGDIIHAEILGRLHEAINELPKGCGLVIRMGYLEGLKNPQIADILQVSVNTVKTQKQRGLMLLREKLGDTVLLVLLLFS